MLRYESETLFRRRFRVLVVPHADQKKKIHKRTEATTVSYKYEHCVKSLYCGTCFFTDLHQASTKKGHKHRKNVYFL